MIYETPAGQGRMAHPLELKNMSFFKIRVHSLVAVVFIAAIFWGQPCGHLLAALTTFPVNSLSDLITAIEKISEQGNAGDTFVVNINKTLTLTDNLPELNIPSGVTVNINGGGINGDNKYNGLVIKTESGANVTIFQTTFNNRGLVLDTEAGGMVNFSQVTFNNCVVSGSGTDAGLGGALFVHGQPNSVTLTDVQLNNKSGGIFLDGTNIIVDNSVVSTIGNNISDISATTDFDKWQKDASGHYVLVTSAGGITIHGSNPVTLTGNNNYAGVTLIETGATLVADGIALTDSNGKQLKDALTGKTIHNAIGNLSEVQIDAGGTLQLNKSETIGFLSGNGNVELKGNTLILAGDEDRDFFGQGINPATGFVVGAFDGHIVTDANG